jgi:hypothetical protein
MPRGKVRKMSTSNVQKSKTELSRVRRARRSN